MNWIIGKKSQIWVETVIFTLIGLVILGILLAIVTPKINQIKDKTILIHTMVSLNTFHQAVSETLLAPGNKREILISVSKGEYVLDGKNETVYYILESSTYQFSQLNQPTTSGNLIVLTKDGARDYDVYLMLNYSGFNLTYEGKDLVHELTQAPIPYKLLIENEGKSPVTNLTNINIQQI